MNTKAQDNVKGRVAFIHPDLGLGGAERLIVDAAVGLKSRGFHVTIYTGYHDKQHAFPETFDGTLEVVKVGQWIPRSILGRLVAVMSYLKMALVALYLTLVSINKRWRPDVVICDQVSACIPFLKVLPCISSPKVMFYCHFPDQLLAIRESYLKSLYRAPIDYIEEVTTAMADKIVVNSCFTRTVFRDTFGRIKIVPDILYPSINSKLIEESLKSKNPISTIIPKVKHLFLSVNRFEEKKNIQLAIRALKKLRTCVSEDEWNNVHLILAGGYDPRLQSSVNYLEKLRKIVADEGVADHVTFSLSPKDNIKIRMLFMCSALVYTPTNEHFGIVPLEAMFMGKPVIAVNSGGPTETVVDEETGFLCPANESNFATAMGRIVKEPELAAKMGKQGKQRFLDNFSFNTFSKSWEQSVLQLINSANDRSHGHQD